MTFKRNLAQTSPQYLLFNLLFNHSQSSHLNKVRDSQSSDLDDATIAHEEGKHFDKNMHFSGKLSYLTVFS